MFKLLVVLALALNVSSQFLIIPYFGLDFGNSTSSSPPSTSTGGSSSSGSSSSSPPSTSSGSSSPPSTSSGSSSSSGASSSGSSSGSSASSSSGSNVDYLRLVHFSYESCGDQFDLAQNVEFDVEIQLPKPYYKLFLEADLLRSVTSGTSVYTVIQNGYNYTEVEDLCNDHSFCPLTMGFMRASSMETVPHNVAGRVEIRNEWFDSDSLRILCINYSMTLV